MSFGRQAASRSQFLTEAPFFFWLLFLRRCLPVPFFRPRAQELFPFSHQQRIKSFHAPINRWASSLDSPDHCRAGGWGAVVARRRIWMHVVGNLLENRTASPSQLTQLESDIVNYALVAFWTGQGRSLTTGHLPVCRCKAKASVW